VVESTGVGLVVFVILLEEADLPRIGDTLEVVVRAFHQASQSWSKTSWESRLASFSSK